MKTGSTINKQQDFENRRQTTRPSGADRRSGQDDMEIHLLRGTLAATASIVFQFSHPFTIIFGYVDLLIKKTREKHTRQKLIIIRKQLEIISEILDDFREVDSFTTKNFDGVEMLVTDKLMEEEPKKS